VAAAAANGASFRTALAASLDGHADEAVRPAVGPTKKRPRGAVRYVSSDDL
jgi:hypothetical protein